MINYSSIDIRAFMSLRAFAREQGEVAFVRMVTAALGCLIADDPASHRHRWAVARVQGALDRIWSACPATAQVKLRVIQTTDTSASEVIDVDAARDLAAFAFSHGSAPFSHLVIAALPSEHGPGEPWAIERVNLALDAVASASERRISPSISPHDFKLAVIAATRVDRPDGTDLPDGTIPRGGIEV